MATHLQDAIQRCRSIAIGLSPKSILFFSVSRIVPFFMFGIKSLFLKGKKSGALFSLYAAHMAFERVGIFQIQQQPPELKGHVCCVQGK